LLQAQVRKTAILPLLDSLLAWAAHSEHQEVWAGPSWSSIALKVRSLLLPGVQDPSKSVLLQVPAGPDAAYYSRLFMLMFTATGGVVTGWNRQRTA
jgi:hypothetical protein